MVDSNLIDLRLALVRQDFAAEVAVGVVAEVDWHYLSEVEVVVAATD